MQALCRSASRFAPALSAPFEFRLPDGARGFDIDDHAVIGVDQVVGGVGEEGVSLVRAGPLGRRIGPQDGHGRHGRSGSNRPRRRGGGGSSGAARIAVSLIFSGFHARLATDRCLLASAAIKLASMVNRRRWACPLGNATLHHALEKPTQLVALAGKSAPCLFFENAE